MNALLCLGDLVHTLDKHAVLEILETIQRCTAVDHSAPTLMCTLGVANSILKQVIVFTDACNSFPSFFICRRIWFPVPFGLILCQYGVEYVAEHVLPLLVPLLTAQQLNVQQFAKYMLFVKDILRYYNNIFFYHSPSKLNPLFLTCMHMRVKSFSLLNLDKA